MKGKREGKRGLERPQSYKVLEGESQKLKDKLEGLRQQIKAKKHEKELSKTMHSMGYSSNKPNNNTTTTNIKDEHQFKLTLAEIKIEKIEHKLREKGIINLELLNACSEEDVDQWKDIEIGYKIKLKKYLENNKKTIHALTANHPPQKQEMNIEQIIKHRKAEKIFIPLKRNNQDEDQSEPELEEAEQEKMMLSILEVISVKQRVSCLSKRKKPKKKKNQKTVHWSPTVEEMQKHHKIKVYPKETISKSLFHLQETQKDPDIIKVEKRGTTTTMWDKGEPLNYKYCWSCLKKINNTLPSASQRCFCSQSCEFNYQATVNPTKLLRQMEETQDKYNEYLMAVSPQAEDEQIDLIFQ